ncbi:MAG: hypothetical protein ACE5OS_04660 [Anaerolineae bacterium]
MAESLPLAIELKCTCSGRPFVQAPPLGYNQSKPSPVPPTPTSVPQGKTIVVTSTADSGPGSLRQALLDAESGDTINFDPNVFPPSAPVIIQKVMGIDVLEGFEQQLVTSIEDRNPAIRNLLVKDYPIILRLTH